MRALGTGNHMVRGGELIGEGGRAEKKSPHVSGSGPRDSVDRVKDMSRFTGAKPSAEFHWGVILYGLLEPAAAAQ